MSNRFPESGPDLEAAAGLREAWMVIDFYLIQSFNAGLNPLAVGWRQSLHRSFNSQTGP